MINYDEIDAARDDVAGACVAYSEVKRLVAVVDQMEDIIARLSLTPSEVEALRLARRDILLAINPVNDDGCDCEQCAS